MQGGQEEKSDLSLRSNVEGFGELQLGDVTSVDTRNKYLSVIWPKKYSSHLSVTAAQLRCLRVTFRSCHGISRLSGM